MENDEYQVKIMSTAVQELKEAVRYIAKNNPINAQRFAAEVRKIINTTLKINPRICLPPRNYPVLEAAGYKSFSIHTNYTVLFVIVGNVIEIRHIIHSRRDWSVIIGIKNNEDHTLEPED